MKASSKALRSDSDSYSKITTGARSWHGRCSWRWHSSAQEREGSTVYMSRGITLNWIQLPYAWGYIACKEDVVSNSVHPGDATVRQLVCHRVWGRKQITTSYPKLHSKLYPQSFKITRFLLIQIPDVSWYQYPYYISVDFNKRPKVMFEKY